MKRIKVESSNLASIGYDKTKKVLEVEFHTKKVYQYFDVPATVYDELMAAESHGRYFNANIRSDYAYAHVK